MLETASDEPVLPVRARVGVGTSVPAPGTVRSMVKMFGLPVSATLLLTDRALRLPSGCFQSVPVVVLLEAQVATSHIKKTICLRGG